MDYANTQQLEGDTPEVKEPAVAYCTGRRAAEPWAVSGKGEAAAISKVQDRYAILEKSFGMFSDGRLSSERFMAEKRLEKELEG
jgi:hypothetical protein